MLRNAGITLLALMLPFARGAAAAEDRAPASLEPTSDYAGIAGRVARALPSKHLTRVLLDDTISRRAWTNYLSSLDFERVYFLDGDIERFRQCDTRLDDDISEGRLDFAYEVFEVFKQRVADRCRFVESLLETGFDLSKDETYLLRRRDMPWPTSDRERDDIWRKKIKNEYLREMLAREFGQTRGDGNETGITTNAPATERSAGPPASEDGSKDALLPGAVKTPSLEATILKRYTQLLTVLTDGDAESVLQRYLTAFAQAYDPHSLYLTPDAGEDFEIEMKLSLVGIGAILRAEDGAAKIVRLIPGGPADRDRGKNRLEPGDKIIAVGQGDEEPVDILHRPLNKIVRLIRGEKGTQVVLTVIPASDPTESIARTVKIVRDEVKLEEQAASWDLRTVPAEGGADRKLGVIKLPAFYANMQAQSAADPDFRSCTHDVTKGIEELRKQGAEGIILDLRNNGGGSLLEAIRMVGLFIRTGPAVMVKERRTVRVLPDPDPDVAYDGPLLVLVNRLSASASEIVAGALQDYHRAVIVGDSKTHGKGTVQTILRLGLDPNMGSVKVTTASYYRISGASTQLRGVSPDIAIPSAYDFMEIGEDYLPYPIEWSTVQPAEYAPVANLSSVIQTLRSRSEERLKTDQRYEVYRGLLERVKELSDRREVPLSIDRRRDMAAEERHLADLQTEIFPVQEDADADGKTGKEDYDVVLDETFRILSDLCEFHEASARPQTSDAAAPDKQSWPELIEQLLRNL